MRVRTSLVLALTLSAAAIGLACSGTYDHPCESLGGQCVTGEGQCGESMPQYYCSVGVCCLPAADAATSTTPAADASASTAPSGDAGK